MYSKLGYNEDRKTKGKRMFLIKEKKSLRETVTQMVIEAPHVTKHAQVGQFVMIRTNENSERIPLTIADKNIQNGTISIIFQIVGKSTYELNQLQVGDFILDVAGPLGKGSELEGLSRVLLIGGGVGCAILYPIAKELKDKNTEIYSIIGFRNQSLVFLEDEFMTISNRFNLLTDDGSYGEQGLVTDLLERALEEGIIYDKVIAIGPIPMMKAVSEMTKKYHIPTVVSMNPIMVDGTGMCGGCRIQVGGQMKFACVDGPEFDGHQVNFDLAIVRNSLYKEHEKLNYQDVLKKGEQS